MDDAADGSGDATAEGRGDPADRDGAPGGSDGASGDDSASGEDGPSRDDGPSNGDATGGGEFHVDPAALADCEGWQVEGYAARVHYRGADDRYSVEYYGPSNCVLYWKVKGDGETAVPVGRATVPAPLRQRIREDLAAAGIDPAAEERPL